MGISEGEKMILDRESLGGVYLLQPQQLWGLSHITIQKRGLYAYTMAYYNIQLFQSFSRVENELKGSI